MEDNVKLQLGHLIQYYRKKRKKEQVGSIYGQDKFINNFITKEPICSIKTLYNIEHNQIVKNDDIYELLLKNLRMRYIYNEKYNDLIISLTQKLYKALEEHHKQSLLEVEKELNENMDMKNYAIYKEFYLCCKLILNYELHRKISTDLEFYINIVSIFDSKLICMVAMIVNEINCETLVRKDIVNKCYMLFENNHIDDSLYRLFMGKVYLYSGKYIQAYDIFLNLYNDNGTTNSLGNQLLIITIIIRIESYLDITFTIQNRLNDLLHLLQYKRYFSKNLLLNTYIGMGILYYEADDYVKSIECFNYAEQIDRLSFILYAPYYYNANERLNKPIIIRNLESVKEIHPHYYNFAYYYTMKYKEYTNEYMLTYLMEEILKYLKIATMGKSLDKIYLNETIQLAIKTRKYQMVVEYLSDFYT